MLQIYSNVSRTVNYGNTCLVGYMKEDCNLIMSPSAMIKDIIVQMPAFFKNRKHKTAAV